MTIGVISLIKSRDTVLSQGMSGNKLLTRVCTDYQATKEKTHRSVKMLLCPEVHEKGGGRQGRPSRVGKVLSSENTCDAFQTKHFESLRELLTKCRI